MEDHLLLRLQQAPELGVGHRQVARHVLVAGEGPVLPLHRQLVVVVEVVRRGRHRDDQVEALLADPDDLLLAAHLAVVRPESTRPLTDRELVLDHPVEVPGLDPLCPLALRPACYLLAFVCVISATVSRICDGRELRRGMTSRSAQRRRRTARRRRGSRTIRAPQIMAHVAVANEPSSRSSSGTGSGALEPSPHPPTGARDGAPGRRRSGPAGCRSTASGWSRPRPDALGHRVVEPTQQGHVVRGGLAEADAGVDPHLGHAGLDRGTGPVGEEGPDVVDDVVVAGLALHGPGIARHVHGDPPDAEVRGHRPQTRR